MDANGGRVGCLDRLLESTLESEKLSSGMHKSMRSIFMSLPTFNVGDLIRKAQVHLNLSRDA